MNDVMLMNATAIVNAEPFDVIWNGTIDTVGTLIPNNLNGYWLDGVWYPAVPLQSTYPTWLPSVSACCCTSFCLKCFVEAMEKLKGLPMATTTPTKTLADTLLAQAKTRLDEIQKRLDEIAALEAEKIRLQKIVDAAG